MTDNYQNIEKEFPQDQVKSNAWMLSFIDTMSILIIFFILLYSTSHKVKPPKVKSYSSMKPESKDKYYINKDYTYELINAFLKKHRELENAVLLSNENELILTIPANILFKNADLNQQAMNIINLIQELLLNLDNSITINGIDCSNNSDVIKANLKLPLLWAITIASKFKEIGYEYNIAIHGLTGKEHQLEGLKDNKKYQQRIDIIIHDTKAN